MSNIVVSNSSPPLVTISNINFNGVAASCDTICPCTPGNNCTYTTNQIGLYQLDISCSNGMISGCLTVTDSTGYQQNFTIGAGYSGIISFSNVRYDGITDLLIDIVDDGGIGCPSISNYTFQVLSGTSIGTLCTDFPSGAQAFYTQSFQGLWDLSVLYTDFSCTTTAPNGFYTNGIYIWEITGLGVLQNQTLCSAVVTPTPTQTPDVTPTNTQTPTPTNCLLTGSAYFGNTIEKACSYSLSGISVIFSADTCDLCTATSLTGNTFASQTTGTYYLNYNSDMIPEI